MHPSLKAARAQSNCFKPRRRGVRTTAFTSKFALHDVPGPLDRGFRCALRLAQPDTLQHFLATSRDKAEATNRDNSCPGLSELVLDVQFQLRQAPGAEGTLGIRVKHFTNHYETASKDLGLQKDGLSPSGRHRPRNFFLPVRTFCMGRFVSDSSATLRTAPTHPDSLASSCQNIDFAIPCSQHLGKRFFGQKGTFLLCQQLGRIRHYVLRAVGRGRFCARQKAACSTLLHAPCCGKQEIWLPIVCDITVINFE